MALQANHYIVGTEAPNCVSVSQFLRATLVLPFAADKAAFLHPHKNNEP